MDNISIQECQEFEWLQKQLYQCVKPGSLQQKLRDEFATKILNLCHHKQYKQETMHLALNIFDRVLLSPSLQGYTSNRDSYPLLMVTCVILGAKIEQPLTPSIKMTIKLLSEDEKQLVTKEDVITLEREILNALEFDLNILSPVPFLERFLRLSEQLDNKDLARIAKDLCVLAKARCQFLKFKQSTIALGALQWAYNFALDMQGVELEEP
jgi:hypothetical protein